MLHESCGVKNQCLYILRYTVHLYILSNSICCRHNGHHRLKKKKQKTIIRTDCICSVYGICTQPRGTAFFTALELSFYFFCIESPSQRTFPNDEDRTDWKYWGFNRPSPLSAVFFLFSYIYEFIHMHAGVHFVFHAICCCMQWQAAVLRG